MLVKSVLQFDSPEATTQGVSQQCSTIYGYSSLSVLSILGLIGAIGNAVLLGCIISRKNKLPTDVVVGFLAVLDLSFNLGLTPAIIWMNNYSQMINGEVWTITQIKYEAYVCCFYSFTTASFFFCIAFTRYLSLNSRTRTKVARNALKTGFLTLLVCILLIAAVALVSVKYSHVYIGSTILMMISTLIVYLVLYFEIRSYVEVSIDKPSSAMSAAQRGAIVSLLYATLISFLLLIPCMSTMFIWCWDGYSDFFWDANSRSCRSFILINVFHHPLMAINFCCHPIILFSTSRMLREECYVFVRRVSLKLSGGYAGVSSASATN